MNFLLRSGAVTLLLIAAGCESSVSPLEELNAQCAQGVPGACAERDALQERIRKSKEIPLSPDGRPLKCSQGFEGEVTCQ